MKRLIVIIGLLTCAQVQAASLESLVMPGPVAAAHAELEEECSTCHAPFSKATQSSLCLDCHEDIAEDQTARRGFHGTAGRLAEQECRSCHTEHQGRGADIVALVPEAFDHTLTGFELAGRHAEATCRDCHEENRPYRDAPAACAGCHGDDDPHRGNLGDDCQSCHAAERWLDHGFDHVASTGFTLNGAHASLACESCHPVQTYADTPTECATCHALDDVHGGARGSDCASCHSESSWTDARFDHGGETGFDLQGAHGELACAACHLDAMALAEPPTDCNGCHSADDVHRGQRGPDCAACHDQSTWNVRFDHGQRTGFPLTGAHETLDCDTCHRGSLEDSLPTDCEGCHEADDPHGGTLGACTDCHDPQGWTEPLRFDHEFTRFPLLGLHRLAACEQCHATLDFPDVGENCADCHRADDVHEGSLGADCASCHNPGGWARWQFDHDAQTSFALTGAHQDLACEGCHRRGQPGALGLSTACGACHQNDDVHNGQFGQQCDRCHTTTDFSDSRRMF